ncbi:MAG TPA: BON domain-containing protein [Burkholderiaceae bacterium]|nr:BON domain-containing protein [Burkholderiaceae bacterium]
MKFKITAACLLAVSLSAPMMAAHADDAGHPVVFVADSGITTKIKAKLAAQHLTSLAHIKVDTDDKGVVWLGGYAKTQAQVDAAVATANDTAGVRAVKNNIMVKADD